MFFLSLILSLSLCLPPFRFIFSSCCRVARLRCQLNSIMLFVDDGCFCSTNVIVVVDSPRRHKKHSPYTHFLLGIFNKKVAERKREKQPIFITRSKSSQTMNRIEKRINQTSVFPIEIFDIIRA